MDERTADRTDGMTKAGLMAEILEHSALLEGRNILVDGSMRDGEWYALHFASLRRRFPRLRVAIIHVSSHADVALQQPRSCEWPFFSRWGRGGGVELFFYPRSSFVGKLLGP